jgi:HEAT repeat protein
MRLLLVTALAVVAGCGRQRQPNVAPGEERVFRKRVVVEAGAPVTTRGREDEIVSPEEAMRRAMVRQLEKVFQDAKSGDDRLDALDKLLQHKIRAPELVPYVARSLSDQDPDQRMYAVKARAAISPGDAIGDIKLVLRDADAKVRQAAVESIALLPEPLPFDALFAHLEN